MAEKKTPDKSNDKKFRRRDKIKDILPDGSKEDVGFSRSLDSLLTVQKAPILVKNKTCTGSYTARHEAIPSYTHEIKLNKNDIGEIPSIDELGLSVLPEPSNDVPLSETNFSLESINPSVQTSFSTTKNFPLDLATPSKDAGGDPDISYFKQKEDMAELLFTNAQSQAYLSVLDDNDAVQRQSLLQLCPERDIPYQLIANSSNNISEELTETYKKLFVELSYCKDKEIEVLRQEASQQLSELEEQMKNLSGSLLIAECDIAAKEDLELSLNERIKFLENLLQQKEENCREELEGVMAKQMKSEIVLAAKEEIEYEVARNSESDRVEEKMPANDIDLIASSLVTSVLKKFHPKENSDVTTIDVLKSEIQENLTELNTLRDKYQVLKETNNSLEKKVNDLQEELRSVDVRKNNESHRVSKVCLNCAELVRDESQKIELSTKSRTDENSHNGEMEWSRITEATQYIECFTQPAMLMLDASCQVSRENLDAECQVSLLQADPVCQEQLFKPTQVFPSDLQTLRNKEVKHRILEKDLQTSWTERCEVEQQLTAVVSENALIRIRMEQLEASSRRAAHLLEDGLPSVASWLQLRSYIKEIAAELVVLREYEMERSAGGKTVPLKTFVDASCNVPPSPCEVGITDLNVGERSSPEGGRESPGVVDGVTALEDFQNTDSEHIQMIDAQNITLDQSSGALLEIVQELMRRFGDVSVSGGDENVTCGSLNATGASGNCSALHDPDERCRCLQHIKDEVSRIFALSRKADPEVAKLQEEVKSLEQQVIASDKQVKLTRAFLEEQAVERESERDESTKKINEMVQLLKLRDRQLASKTQLEQDVENLELQLSESQENFEREVERCAAAEKKLESMMQKIGCLREVIEGLEVQLAESREQLEAQTLEVNRQQNRLQDLASFSLERENAQLDSFSDTLAYTGRLEEELTNLRQQMEAFGPDSLVAARTSLLEIECAVVRRTRELELVQVAWNGALSSASEELSIRDHVDVTRCATPDEMALEAGTNICEDIERLRDRIMKLSRMQEGVVKKMKEFEMIAAKSDELRLDHEGAMQKLYELLSENEALKSKLETFRIQAPNGEVIEQLEAKVKQLANDLEIAQEFAAKEKSMVKEVQRREEKLKETVDLLERQLIIEDKEHQELKKKLDEKAQLVPRESSGTSSILEKPVSVSSSSSSTPKRVRFQVPESFVGHSLTPISAKQASLLRDAPEADNFDGWTMPGSIARKHPLLDSISSVGALHLSPRRSPHPESPSDFYSAILDSPILNQPVIRKEVAVNTEMISPHCVASLLEREQKIIDNYSEKIRMLEAELNSQRQQNKENQVILDEVKVRAAGSNEHLQKKCDYLETQIVKQSEQVTSLELKLSLALSENQKHFDLLSDKNTQIDLISKELGNQRNEACQLKDILSETFKELEAIKIDREEMLHQQTKFNEAEVELSELKEKYFEASQKISELLLVNKTLHEEKERQLLMLNELKNKLETEMAVLQEQYETEKGKVGNLTEALRNEESKRKCLEENVNGFQNYIDTMEGRMKEGCEKCRDIDQLSSNSVYHDSLEETSKWKKLCAEAATRVSELRSCLESSLIRCASLETERAILKSCVDNSSSKIEALKDALETERHEVAILKEEWQRVHAEDDSSQATSAVESELIVAKLRVEELDTQLRKATFDLAGARSNEALLRKALETSVEYGQESAKTASALQGMVENLERDNLQLKYTLENEIVKVRGLEKLQQRLPPFSQSVRSGDRATQSAGSKTDRPGSLQWQLHRVESYRKALIWQKQYLQIKTCMWHGNRQRKPTLRIVAFAIISVLRMKFLVRRWRNRLPPLTAVSTTSRKQSGGGERPLVLASPPCKDPGLRLNVMK